VKVEQAIFGERRGGHALREATGDRQLAAEFASRLDLPDTAPSGVVWSPFTSGFPHADRYVLARTFLDPQATRGGMVLSHALIISLEDIIHCTDLRPLFARLITEARQPQALATFDVDLQGEAPPSISELVGVAEALTTKGTGPIVRLGLNGFEELVIAIWARVWPAIRRTFSFRLSFGPSDAVENPAPTMICTPAVLATRWQGHRIIDPAQRQPATLSAALLVGRDEGASLLQFGDLIGAEIVSFSDLSLLEQAYRFAELEPDTFVHTATAIRLIERLSPDPTKGAAAKGSLLERLQLHLESADANAILTLRNLELRGFPAHSGVWERVQRCVEMSTFPAAEDSPLLILISDAVVGRSAIAPWREAVAHGLRAAAGRAGGGFALGFWRWAEISPSLLSALAKSVDLNRELEALLADAAPSIISAESAQAVLRLASERRLPDLHAVAASALYSVAEAARAQIKMEGTDRRARGLTLALRNATPEELVASATEISDPQLLDLAAAAVARRPGLLATADMGMAAGQALWAAGLAKNPSAWSGPNDPAAVASQVLTNMLDGGPLDQGLVEALAQTPLADLGCFARRAELWGKLNAEPQRLFLEATANGWINKACTGDVPFAPDHQLEEAILHSRKLSEALDTRATGGVAAGLRLIAALPSFREERFLTWLQSVVARVPGVPVGEAEALGRLVLDRRWRRVVDELVHHLRRKREDLRPALRVCISMLGLFTSWMLGLSSLTPTEKWESFEGLASDLYPTGPDHDELWERAGGSDADLPRNGNGRSRWHETLSKMQRGGGRVRADQLLRKMQKDYPMNDQLRFLTNDSEFGGRR
jgi:hypothetical protein